VCCDNLRRRFSVWATRPDGGYFGRFGRPPADEAEFAAEYLPKLRKLVAMTDRSVILTGPGGPSAPIDTKLEEMVSDLKRRGKTAVLLLLPWHSGLDLPQSAELAEVAKRYCIHFLDGFELFKGDTAARPEYPYRPRLDAHWLEPASERFAEILAPKIKGLKGAVAPHCADGG